MLHIIKGINISITTRGGGEGVKTSRKGYKKGIDERELVRNRMV